MQIVPHVVLRRFHSPKVKISIFFCSHHLSVSHPKSLVLKLAPYVRSLSRDS